MIIRYTGSTLLLITQPDHAALAGRIMREWSRDDLSSPPRRDDILRAIDEHDNGWREVDHSPIVDEGTGRILDFVSAPDHVRQAVWPRGVERLAGNPYAAALVAQHAIHVYARYRDRPGWASFFSMMEARRDRHLSAVPGATLDQLLRDYVPVRIGDLISLTFCNGWTDPQRESGYEIKLEENRVTVTPDPFGGRSIDIDAPAVALPDRPYPSAEGASKAFQSAPRCLLTGTVLGAIRDL